MNYVRIVSSDKEVNNIIARIEKSYLIDIWIGKSSTYFSRYFDLLDLAETEKDPVKAGILIHDLEAQFIAAVTLLIRCFNDQPTFHLERSDIGTVEGVQECFDEIMKVRNDEFVHWKGIRSNLNVSYSFEPVNHEQIEFAKTCGVHFSDQIGPSFSKETVFLMLNGITKSIEKKRNKSLGQLRNRLAVTETYKNTQIIGENGKPVVVKE